MQMKKVREMLSAVLDEITPVDDDHTLRNVKRFLEEVAHEAQRLKIKGVPVLGGSFAKNTWLKGDYDVDVFFRFNLKYKNDVLSDLLEKILKKFGAVRIHGSRDYFQIRNEVCFEVIPVLDIKKSSDAQNVTDFSLGHVAWVNRKGKKLKNAIRLGKKFCKAQRVYGAESYIRGFSGHVLDILIIHYGGCMELLRAAAKWTPKVVIDPENKYKGKALQFLNASKTKSPLVVVDPVQSGRNASAAMSLEQFEAFVRAAKACVKKPSEKFFVQTAMVDADFKKKGTLLKMQLVPVDGVENVVGVKLLKAGEFLKKALDDFGVVASAWEWDKRSAAVWWFVVKQNVLSKEIIVEGPPLRFKEHVVRFKKAHKKTFIKKNKVFAMVKRDYIHPEDAVRAAAKHAYVKDKVKAMLLL